MSIIKLVLNRLYMIYLTYWSDGSWFMDQKLNGLGALIHQIDTEPFPIQINSDPLTALAFSIYGFNLDVSPLYAMWLETVALRRDAETSGEVTLYMRFFQYFRFTSCCGDIQRISKFFTSIICAGNLRCFVLCFSNFIASFKVLINQFFFLNFCFQVAVLLLTEITPKSIAVHNATEVARFVVSYILTFF